MKKLLLISVLSFCLVGNGQAQETSTGKSKHSFVEWNFGVAYTDYGYLPGTSVLLGRTHISENNFIVEYEAGLAFPTLVTGKLGIGKKFNNTKVVVGVRPFPFNLYLQSSFTNGEKGYWITSVEYNPINPISYSYRISFESTAIFNFGYRWDLNRGK